MGMQVAYLFMLFRVCNALCHLLSIRSFILYNANTQHKKHENWLTEFIIYFKIAYGKRVLVHRYDARASATGLRPQNLLQVFYY